jgi:hypothetical protein
VRWTWIRSTIRLDYRIHPPTGILAINVRNVVSHRINNRKVVNHKTSDHKTNNRKTSNRKTSGRKIDNYQI